VRELTKDILEKLPEIAFEYLGNFSAVDPAYSRGMVCFDCKVKWTGCWDNFQCPKCGEGELPYDCDGIEASK